MNYLFSSVVYCDVVRWFQTVLFRQTEWCDDINRQETDDISFTKAQLCNSYLGHLTIIVSV